MKRAVTMGNFDGCHLGHQALFRTLKAVAEVNHLQPTVISFEPHSNYVLRGPGDPLLLTTTEEKREFVESLGIEFLVLPFTSELAKLPFDKFVRTELIEKRNVVSMFFGHDHINNFEVDYQGVKFCYGIKSTDRIYHDEDMMGCQTITIHDDHSLTIDRYYHTYAEVK